MSGEGAALAARLGLESGFQVLAADRLPFPLLLHLPTIVTGVGGRGALERVEAELLRLLPEDTLVAVVEEGPGEPRRVPLGGLDPSRVRFPVALFVDPEPAGWPGLVATVRRLRTDCPWDARQTHHSLARHLVEECYEVLDAIGALPPDAPGGAPDPGAYASLRGELGDLMLQAVFHATMAVEAGAFDVEQVAEGIRRKLVRRHPHVFGEVEVSGPQEVIRNWERLKQQEEGRASLMDDVPEGMPALARAAKVQRRAASVGFDWSGPEPVVDQVAEELGELREVLEDPDRAEEEMGDLLMAVVNLARHLHVDPEMALRRATTRFEERFRAMEAEGSLEGLTLEELDRRWERAKRR